MSTVARCIARSDVLTDPSGLRVTTKDERGSDEQVHVIERDRRRGYQSVVA